MCYVFCICVLVQVRCMFSSTFFGGDHFETVRILFQNDQI
jgi:hypothetical protein